MTLFARFSTARRVLKCPRLAIIIIIMHILENSLPPCCLNYYYYFFFVHYKLGNMVAFILPAAAVRVRVRTHTHNQRQKTTYKSY